MIQSKAKPILVLLGLALAIGVASAQKNKPWTDWTKIEAQKILNDSGWGKTQTDTDTSEMTYSPASRPITGQGAVNQATSVDLRVRFLSAKPIRLAYLRLAQLDRAHTAEQLAQTQAFVDRKFDQTIVIGVTYECPDGRYTAPLFQVLNNATAAALKNTTYIEVKGGKRNYLQDYQPPSQNGLAWFIFARIVDDKPYIDAKSGEVRFYSDLPQLSGNNQPTNNRKDSTQGFTINMRFKIADLMYEGALEF